MHNKKIVYLNVAVVSVSVVCFEIISTRISSVIFVSNFAFIILSLAILGLGCGAVYSYYRIPADKSNATIQFLSKSLISLALSYLVFIILITGLEFAANPFIYFFLLFIPFFTAGVFYSLVFRIYSALSFKIYAADLIGAAIGSVGSIILLSFSGAANAVLLLTVFILALFILLKKDAIKKSIQIISYSILAMLVLFISSNGDRSLLGKIPIGQYPEKDFYHVYENVSTESEIIESRWSVYGRSDLVEYSHQNVVKQLFIDGAAGTQMYSFNGSLTDPGELLLNLLYRNSSAVPFLYLNESQKNRMLVIGPGGGKEVLTGLLAGVDNITGVEVNPDFVEIVKDYKNYNGGIYTEFPNIKIVIDEGRHYAKKSEDKYDIIQMVLPSTEQIQNIDNIAANENFLLTVEALKDYLNILTNEGQLILTLHNDWEISRLITTAFSAFEELGIQPKETVKHLMIYESDYAPTIIIKRKKFSEYELFTVRNSLESLPSGFPKATFYPDLSNNTSSRINNMLSAIADGKTTVDEIIEKDEYNLKPCRDDSPYFYNINRGIPGYILYLFLAVAGMNIALIFYPLAQIKRKIAKTEFMMVINPLIIFCAIGLGFMIIEISIFQKLILFIGSPTIALSILLGSILIGMGIGSMLGKEFIKENVIKRIYSAGLAIILVGIMIFFIYPFLLEYFITLNLFYKIIICLLLMMPLGAFAGIPFPSAIQLLRESDLNTYIPWMYGLNGTFSVLGSVSAVVISLVYGFKIAFFFGLSIYLVLSVYLFLKSKENTAN
ncbi:MAG: hypothetical protein JW995_04830 [Melioribacteraceae bacterium]|nr:hypothetical protein [Melioribacteraceae bacterium]